MPEARDGRRPVTVAAPAVPARRWDGPLLLLVAGIVLASALVALPVLLKEETRDWIAYEQAATRLDTGQPLYIWQLATEDDEYYLYPPGMAALWAVAGSPELLIAAKVLALLAVGSLAPLVVEDPSKRRLAAVLLAAGAVIWPPNLYDIVLGNVDGAVRRRDGGRHRATRMAGGVAAGRRARPRREARDRAVHDLAGHPTSARCRADDRRRGRRLGGHRPRHRARTGTSSTCRPCRA